ncbi:MAG: RNA polymerase sigma factor [Acidimicrobiia bacterium]
MESTIWEQNSRDLVRYAAALIGPDHAEDAVSSVFVRIIETVGFEQLDEPRPYLFKAVLNECRSRAARQRREVPMFPEVAGGEIGEQFPEVLRAVMALPVQQKAATYLVYWKGFSIAQASELMGLRDGTVKRYLHLARRSLRHKLDGILVPSRGDRFVD